MNINMTTSEGATEVDAQAERYRVAYEKTTRGQRQFKAGREQSKEGRALWIDGTLELAAVVAEKRIDLPDHRAFGRWLQQYHLEPISEADRAALSGFSRDLQAARAMLEASKAITWRGVWEKVPKGKKRTPSGVGGGTLSARTGAAHRKRQQIIPTVMRDDYEPGSVPRLAEPLSPKQRRRRRVMQEASPPPPPRKGVLLKGLTKEQVDPDFQGTHLEFITKYGHVNLQTKQQIEHHKSQEELMAWLGLVSDHERTARALLAAAAVDPAVLREWMSKPAKAAKMQAWRDSIERASEIIRSFEREDDPVLPLFTEYVHRLLG